MSCLLEIPGGISNIGLLASLGSLGYFGTSFLGVSAVCFGRSIGCLRSTIFLGTTCLGGRSADCLGRADCLRALARNIKESIFIRVNNSTLNRNTGKFNFPHMWTRVLLKTPGLNLKRHVHAVGHVNSNNFNTPL